MNRGSKTSARSVGRYKQGEPERASGETGPLVVCPQGTSGGPERHCLCGSARSLVQLLTICSDSALVARDGPNMLGSSGEECFTSYNVNDASNTFILFIFIV